MHPDMILDMRQQIMHIILLALIQPLHLLQSRVQLCIVLRSLFNLLCQVVHELVLHQRRLLGA